MKSLQIATMLGFTGLLFYQTYQGQILQSCALPVLGYGVHRIGQICQNERIAHLGKSMILLTAAVLPGTVSGSVVRWLLDPIWGSKIVSVGVGLFASAKVATLITKDVLAHVGRQ